MRNKTCCLRRAEKASEKLLSFSVTEAEKTGVRYLRRYTWDDPNEREARFLDENFGLKEVGHQRKHFYTKIYRELILAG